ncbi:histidine kinase dimerization/phospho-acceptor domain-containing protein [Variovorax sp. JS1663]|uniref:histidine kinase dimerization/phospho-acceptor domain-containing protein n=1 Tax=Variovorax sp. JS1663 TaxID=1851577 RepID=UPI003FD45E64
MLERIDLGYRRLQDFSADLAHEMRTPVATLLGRTQVAFRAREARMNCARRRRGMPKSWSGCRA